jgi:glycosyltransferase involved in cell wall biosynthesis
VLRRLARCIPPGPGVLVAQDWLPLAMASVIDPGRALINMTHGDYDYYYDLAVRHESIIDCFVAPSRHIEARLKRLLPHRVASIVRVPHGVALPTRTRRPVAGPLRLLCVGRTTESKGVFDLPAIDARLRQQQVPVSWTIVGDGPARRQLQSLWTERTHVRFTGDLPSQDVLQLYAEHDVLVMPTRSEGFPLVLLEAGAAGVVAVASDLPSGIPEIVESGVTGYRVPVGDVTGYASSIAALYHGREQLEAMSRRVREVVARDFDGQRRAAEYQALFERYQTAPRQRRLASTPRLQYGSRLDQPWIPNHVVRALRSRLARTPVES